MEDTIFYFVVSFVVIMAITVWRCIYAVPEGMRMITTQFGRFKSVHESGFVLLGLFEVPMRLDRSTFEYVDNVQRGIYLPTQFRFDPEPVEVSSKNSIVTTVDPVLTLRIKDMEKMYFTFPTDDPLDLLMDEMANMMNEVSRRFDMIGRDQFKTIADDTRNAMRKFCESIGIEIVSFELQGMQLSPERMAIEQQAESAKRALQIEANQRKEQQEAAMAAIANEHARSRHKMELKQTKMQTQLAYDLENARKRNEIARAEAESHIQLTALLQEKGLTDAYHRQLEIAARGEMTKGILGGSHTTYVVDQNKMFYPFSLPSPTTAHN
jgi:regulator of protease activity HflC (stomatin/prohibitin superfamily)